MVGGGSNPSSGGVASGAVAVLLVVGVIMGIALFIVGARLKGYKLQQVEQSLLSNDVLTVQQGDSDSRRSGATVNPALSEDDDAEADD